MSIKRVNAWPRALEQVLGVGKHSVSANSLPSVIPIANKSATKHSTN